MPAGQPYFAWIDATETTFGPEHLRWDEQVFSFTLAQDEGDPAHLTVAVRRPRNEYGDPVGLLCPSRKIWAWFAFDCGPDLIRFRGRLVGIPTSLFEDLVTLEFVARPLDVVAQKEALANTLRVLPYYDEVVIEKSRRNDPEVVLEGYTKIWHYDRETLILTVSDEISGEDGTINFDGTSEDGKVLYDGLGLNLTSGPLARVDVVNAEYNWTQQGYGGVDLTGYLLSHWPDGFTSFTMSASDWPKTGAGIGDGWTAASASAVDLNDLTVRTRTGNSTLIVKNFDGVTTATTNVSESEQYISGSTFTIAGGPLVSKNHWSVAYSRDGDGQYYPSSSQSSYTETRNLFAAMRWNATLSAAYTANRPFTERISFSLIADVQPILTDPDDGEALRLDGIRSVNLSEPIDESTGAEIPIGDKRRRSYIATARGNQSLEHLIALARAHLMKRARVVEIAFAPKLSRMCEVTLRKNAFLIEPRVGEATGKIIAYSLALDGSDGRVKTEIRIGCAIGRGGTVAAEVGNPTYCTVDYVGADYQQFANRLVLFPLDTSVGYEPPQAAPNDDGLDLIAGFSAEQAMDQPLSVLWPMSAQIAALSDAAGIWSQVGGAQANIVKEDGVTPQFDAYSAALKAVATKATFKLKSMSREFTTDYQINLTDLKIPTGYNLEVC
jgi:hypothetical protein